MRLFPALLVAMIVLAVCWLTAAAQGPQQQQQCAPLALTLAHSPIPIAAAITLDPEQSRRVMDWYNQQPPESTDTYLTVMVLRHVNNRLTLLFGTDGLVCIAATVPLELVNSLMREIVGDPA
jgi:hypothetical protein